VQQDDAAALGPDRLEIAIGAMLHGLLLMPRFPVATIDVPADRSDVPAGFRIEVQGSRGLRRPRAQRRTKQQALGIRRVADRGRASQDVVDDAPARQRVDGRVVVAMIRDQMSPLHEPREQLAMPGRAIPDDKECRRNSLREQEMPEFVSARPRAGSACGRSGPVVESERQRLGRQTGSPDDRIQKEHARSPL
jgi:hypothetical protein